MTADPNAGPLPSYALAAVLFFAFGAVVLFLGAVGWARFERWLDGREAARVYTFPHREADVIPLHRGRGGDAA